MSGQIPEQTPTVTLTIDGKTISVPKGTTVYHAAQQLGIEVPIFCYQDRMPPFAACRVCLIEVEKMAKLQTACSLEATEGMVVKTQTTMAVEGRKAVLEFLLINHPLDCPICDRGGECPLQDQALKFGPGESRFCEEKRHFKKAVSLGPVLKLDRERCIACARCTRFGEIIAGDHALEFIDRGYRTEVGTPGGKPVESKFIGNTIAICPVGALTSEVYRFRARPWDNDTTESTCALCPVGCSQLLDSRDGQIMRTRAQENKAVNDIWLCDKGWFGYEYTEHPDRLTTPLIRRGDKLEPATWEEALSLIATQMQSAKSGGKIAAFGGNSLTVEENFLLQSLFREGLKCNNIDHRIGMSSPSMAQEAIPPGMSMSIGDCEQLSYAILIGLDLTEEFPVIWLRLKQAILRGAVVIFLGHFAPEIASQLHKTRLHAPGKELEEIQTLISEVQELAKSGNKGALFVGRQYLNSPNRRNILTELHKLTQAVPNLSLNVMEGEKNSMGARLAGVHPEWEPLGAKLEKTGMNALAVLEESANKGWEFLYAVGCNPAAYTPKELWNRASKNLKFLVVQDLFLTETAKEADVVLPTLSFYEKEGSFISIEGRVQKLRPGKFIPQNIYSDEEIFTLLAQKMHIPLSIHPLFLEALQKPFIPLDRDAITTEPPFTAAETKEEGLKATFAKYLFDHDELMLHDPHLIQLAKEPRVRIHPSEGKKRGIDNGDLVRLRRGEKTIAAQVALDDKVALQTLVLPLVFPKVPVWELGADLLNGFAIEIQRDS